MDIMGRCMEKGVQIYSIRDRYILDQALDLPVMGNVFKLVTEIEHSLMSIRTKEALNHKKSTGFFYAVFNLRNLLYIISRKNIKPKT